MDIRIPDLAESVKEGDLATWLKKDGDQVRKDEAILELETDKATVELAAEAAGTLEILVQAGETVHVGDVVGRIVEGGADAGRAARAKAAPERKAEPEAKPQPEAKAKPKPASKEVRAAEAATESATSGIELLLGVRPRSSDPQDLPLAQAIIAELDALPSGRTVVVGGRLESLPVES